VRWAVGWHGGSLFRSCFPGQTKALASYDPLLQPHRNNTPQSRLVLHKLAHLGNGVGIWDLPKVTPSMCFRPGVFGQILGMNLFCCEWSTVERVEEGVTGEKPATELILRIDAPDPGNTEAEI